MTINLDGGYDDNSLSDAEIADTTRWRRFKAATSPPRRPRPSLSARPHRPVSCWDGRRSVTQQQIAAGEDFYQLLRGGASLQAATGLGRTVGPDGRWRPCLRADVSVRRIRLARSATARRREPDRRHGAADRRSGRSLTAQRWLTNRAVAGVYRNLDLTATHDAPIRGLWMQPVAGAGVQSRTTPINLTHAWAAFIPPAGSNRPIVSIATPRPWRAPQSPAAGHAHLGGPATVTTAGCRPNRSISFMVGGGVVGVGRRTPRRRRRSSSTSCRRLRIGRADVSFRTGRRPWARVMTSPCSMASRREPFASDVATLTFDGTAWAPGDQSVTGGYSRAEAAASAAATTTRPW